MNEARTERIVISVTPAQKRAIERYVEDYCADRSSIVTAASLGRHLLLQKAAPYLDHRKRSTGPEALAPDGVPIGAEVRFGKVVRSAETISRNGRSATPSGPAVSPRSRLSFVP